MSSTKIVIEIQGGLVQDVFCSDHNADVTIVDWDSDGLNVGDSRVVEVSDGSTLHLAGVDRPRAVPLERLAGTAVEKAIAAAR